MSGEYFDDINGIQRFANEYSYIKKQKKLNSDEYVYIFNDGNDDVDILIDETTYEKLKEKGFQEIVRVCTKFCVNL